MSNPRQWIALFSQTGGEILRLSKELGRYPDVILTDNKKFKAPDDMPESTTVLKLNTTDINTWLLQGADEEHPHSNVDRGALITAHGYLRIIPEQVINYLAEQCETVIYNGHPGLVTLFPELKGKDPQKRVYEGIKAGKYTVVGSVIHIVDAGVDSGPIILTIQQSINNRFMSEDNVFALQYDLSFKVWLAFLQAQFRK